MVSCVKQAEHIVIIQASKSPNTKTWQFGYDRACLQGKKLNQMLNPLSAVHSNCRLLPHLFMHSYSLDSKQYETRLD